MQNPKIVVLSLGMHRIITYEYAKLWYFIGL